MKATRCSVCGHWVCATGCPEAQDREDQREGEEREELPADEPDPAGDDTVF